MNHSFLESDPRADSERVSRLVDHLPSWLTILLTVLGFGVPIAGYFWLILHYGVNVPYQDGWSDVTVIQHPSSWSNLWAQHNEDRLFFPRLVVIALAHTTHFDVRIEELLSGVLLVIATFLIIGAHKRRSSTTPWLYYCPVVLLAFTAAQYGAALWGFQLAWYLVLVAMALAVFALDRVNLTGPFLVLAIGAAIVGSYSSVQGLLIWPVGIALLFYRRRDRQIWVVWFAAGAVTSLLYVYHLNIAAGSALPSALTHHSVFPPFFATFAIGDVVGVPIGTGGNDPAVLWLGLFILVFAIVTIGTLGVREDRTSGQPVGAALILFGLTFAFLVSLGRHGLGYWGASSSGYTIYDVLILSGIYLVFLDRSRRVAQAREGVTVTTEDRPRFAVSGRNSVVAALVAVSVLIALQFASATPHGLSGARTIHAAEVRSETTARNINSVSDLDVLANLSFYQAPSETRRQVEIARALRVSLFAGSGAG